ncbi:MAG: hypothetical protein OEY30_00185 [Candidatus Bathyarchaeota archaeon]|nr:hypothetical protein [Candidatus Bathyarchaeota archaeon]
MKTGKWLIFYVVSFIALVTIALGYYDIRNSHETLGVYSLSIERILGKDTTGCMAVWYEGYAGVEHGFIQDGSLIGFGTGLGAGLAVTFISTVASSLKHSVTQITWNKKNVSDTRLHRKILAKAKEKNMNPEEFIKWVLNEKLNGS